MSVRPCLREQSRVHAVVRGRRGLSLVPRILLERHLLPRRRRGRRRVHRQRLDVLRVALVVGGGVQVRALVVAAVVVVVRRRQGPHAPAAAAAPERWAAGRHGRAHVVAAAAAAAGGHVPAGWTRRRLRHRRVVHAGVVRRAAPGAPVRTVAVGLHAARSAVGRVRRRRGHLAGLGVGRMRGHHRGSAGPAAARRWRAARERLRASGQDAARGPRPRLHELLVLGPPVLEPDLHLQSKRERERRLLVDDVSVGHQRWMMVRSVSAAGRADWPSGRETNRSADVDDADGQTIDAGRSVGRSVQSCLLDMVI